MFFKKGYRLLSFHYRRNRKWLSAAPATSSFMYSGNSVTYRFYAYYCSEK